MNISFLAHAFGQRYELPIPLALFVIGGAGIVLLSFLLVLPRKVSEKKQDIKAVDISYYSTTIKWPWLVASIIGLSVFCTVGLMGSQTVSENIVSTLFWLIIWIAVPLSVGVIGNWTQNLNPFMWVARLFDQSKIRQTILARDEPLSWKLGWWPAVIAYFAAACGELIFNQFATKPASIAVALIMYGLISAFMGLLFGAAWIQKGELFSVLFSTWGRLGFQRFGAEGIQGFAGGLLVPFEASPSRIAFVLLLLASVAFDGLLATPFWTHVQHILPHSLETGTLAYQLFVMVCFILLGFTIWGLFSLFAIGVRYVGGHRVTSEEALAGLLPSLVPISFGYLLAHNIEYLVINMQLLFPLIGNPVGADNWPIHLPFPFNDSFEPNIHLFPSAFYWYFSVVVIVIVHIIAIVLAHRHLGRATKNTLKARRSEYPWIIAMVGYTMLSLWLLAQPLVKEKPATDKVVGYVHYELSEVSTILGTYDKTS